MNSLIIIVLIFMDFNGIFASVLTFSQTISPETPQQSPQTPAPLNENNGSGGGSGTIIPLNLSKAIQTQATPLPLNHPAALSTTSQTTQVVPATFPQVFQTEQTSLSQQKIKFPLGKTSTPTQTPEEVLGSSISRISNAGPAKENSPPDLMTNSNVQKLTSSFLFFFLWLEIVLMISLFTSSSKLYFVKRSKRK